MATVAGKCAACGTPLEVKVTPAFAGAALAALAFSGFVGAQEGPILIGASIPLTGGVAIY